MLINCMSTDKKEIQMLLDELNDSGIEIQSQSATKFGEEMVYTVAFEYSGKLV